MGILTLHHKLPRSRSLKKLQIYMWVILSNRRSKNSYVNPWFCMKSKYLFEIFWVTQICTTLSLFNDLLSVNTYTEKYSEFKFFSSYSDNNELLNCSIRFSIKFVEPWNSMNSILNFFYEPTHFHCFNILKIEYCIQFTPYVFSYWSRFPK